MTIKTIEVHNIQSLEGTTIFDFPETGIIKFCAPDNNSGKSICIKFLNEVINNNLVLSTRKALINYEEESCYMLITLYNGDSLKIFVHREAKYTYVTLSKIGMEPVTRYLGDKMMYELVNEFGFHRDGKYDFSLNIYNTFDSLIFITTSGAQNASVLDSAISDYRCDTSIENMKALKKNTEVVYDGTKAGHDRILFQISQLKTHDNEKLKKKLELAKALDFQLSRIITPCILEILPIPNLKEIEILNLERGAALALHNFKVYPQDIEILVNEINILDKLNMEMPEILSSAIYYRDTYRAISEGICPVCEKPFKEGEE